MLPGHQIGQFRPLKVGRFDSRTEWLGPTRGGCRKPEITEALNRSKNPELFVTVSRNPHIMDFGRRPGFGGTVADGHGDCHRGLHHRKYVLIPLCSPVVATEIDHPNLVAELPHLLDRKSTRLNSSHL